MAADMVEQVSRWLVIIGALNWGLVGAVNFNLVNLIFGAVPVLEKIVYILVGLAALYEIYAVVKG
ncbi:DUF378 domain-containing protein [Candidatus Woesearchaeota archaeon]|jgi:hypothetical protein|nr:MAG: DUF378 domain-containing protein [Candidatus Woesearchaeota archaeon]